jgi:hypothetical protein
LPFFVTAEKCGVFLGEGEFIEFFNSMGRLALLVDGPVDTRNGRELRAKGPSERNLRSGGVASWEAVVTENDLLATGCLDFLGDEVGDSSGLWYLDEVFERELSPDLGFVGVMFR